MFLLLANCEDENYEFGDIVAPTNIQVTASIQGQDADNPNGDGSGVVNFTATADNAIAYKYVYNGIEDAVPSGEITYSFSELGVNTYTVTVVAIGTGGITSSQVIEVEVLALYEAPDDLKTLLYDFNAGTPDVASSKEWRIKSESDGHFGVGPAEEVSPIWFSAPAGDKAVTGMYDDRYIFNSDGTFEINTNVTNDDEASPNEGTIFGQAAALDQTFGDQGLTPNGNNEHENYAKENYSGTWALTAPGEQETLTLTNDGFFGFFVGGTGSYTILSRTTTEISLKTIGDDGLAWFFVLTSEEEGTTSTPVTNVFTDLVWSDEFDTNGAPDASNWTYDLGAGGWGNQELQTYTNDAENVIIEDGFLKIMAKSDGNGGYTSARLKSQGLQTFTYGKMEVRAKLPASQGTWPAIWMLGSNFTTVGWPTCGEIDIMEQTGQDKTKTSAALHFDGNSGGDAPTDDTDNATSTTEFHNYAVQWTAQEIVFSVDDEVFFTYQNDASLPFNEDFFFILNIAMGGTLGGDIASDFTEDVMEIDYVRVYQ